LQVSPSVREKVAENGFAMGTVYNATKCLICRTRNAEMYVNEAAIEHFPTAEASFTPYCFQDYQKRITGQISYHNVEAARQRLQSS